MTVYKTGGASFIAALQVKFPNDFCGLYVEVFKSWGQVKLLQCHHSVTENIRMTGFNREMLENIGNEKPL